MKWIDKNSQLPPIGEFEDTSINVLVSDGIMIGHGHYDYDSKKWNYNMPGHAELDDNRITHWMMFPELPSVSSQPTPIDYIEGYKQGIHDLLSESDGLDMNYQAEKLISKTKNIVRQ